MGHQYRVVYVDRDPEFFARLAAGGLISVGGRRATCLSEIRDMYG